MRESEFCVSYEVYRIHRCVTRPGAPLVMPAAPPLVMAGVARARRVAGATSRVPAIHEFVSCSKGKERGWPDTRIKSGQVRV